MALAHGQEPFHLKSGEEQHEISITKITKTNITKK